MTVYVITGKLGAGKTKGAVYRIREYLRAGKRVATNLNLHLEPLMGMHSRCEVMRVPDHPSAEDLSALGLGNRFMEMGADGQPIMLKGFDEDHNGALVLDEGGTWLNSRNFQDTKRKAFLDWLWHCRKYGWDLFLICQNVKQIDAQVRESVIEHTVRLHRLDKIKIPGFSAATRLVTAGKFKGTMPKVHVGIVRLGTDPAGLVGDRWVFRGAEINRCYETLQVFDPKYPHGSFSMLPPWHCKGYLHPQPQPWGRRLLEWLTGGSGGAVARAAGRGPVRPISERGERLVELLSRLPADERLRHWQRLNQAGALA